jgi:hypothetical protein
MEALAALSVAGNFIQFVDCGVRWASTAREIYKEGSSKDISELEAVVGDLRQSIPSIKISSPTLAVLIAACSDLTNELDSILQSLRVDMLHQNEDFRRENELDGLPEQNHGHQKHSRGWLQKNRGRKSFKKTIKTMLGKPKIMDIQQRLFRIRDQICAHLNIVLK